MKRLLIANRGEIACRIARAARAEGIETVAVVSQADTDSLAARSADQSIVIGPPPAVQSYLDHDKVLLAAHETDCDAVHPGYGFLAENAAFASRVRSEGLTWVGPDPETIQLMGDKARARAAAEEAGVPTLAGTGVVSGTGEAIAQQADLIGYPLLVKASAGGGGRGIGRVANRSALALAIERARTEAATAFGDPAVYLERFVPHARHVEVQVLGDGERVIHLGDRDCTLQRRSQKVVEEAPAPDLPDDVRELMRSSAVELARRCHYRGAGTLEFLYDPQRGEAAFIEMNTRLQVEHPITEAITGVDIVAEQLRIAAGEPMRLRQEDVRFSGHAIEVRINAENPAGGFFPSPGTIIRLHWPVGPGLRVDAGVEEGSVVTPFYDSLLAKLVVHAPDRDQAIAATLQALDDLKIEGLSTTAPFQRQLLGTPEFSAMRHSTTYLEEALPTLLEEM